MIHRLPIFQVSYLHEGCFLLCSPSMIYSLYVKTIILYREKNMAQLTKEDIKKLSDLCRIDCTEIEQEAILKDLKEILAYIDQLQEIDTQNISPCNHVIPEIKNVMRDDICGETLSKEAFFKNVPSKSGGWVRVPTVISKTDSKKGEE